LTWNYKPSQPWWRHHLLPKQAGPLWGSPSCDSGPAMCLHSDPDFAILISQRWWLPSLILQASMLPLSEFQK
jgi:hypothetical protein